MTPRPYIDATIDQLEQLFKENLHRRAVLGDVRDELTYRRTPRAVRLRQEIEAVLSGEVPIPPAPPRPPSPDDQIDLLDESSDDDDDEA